MPSSTASQGSTDSLLARLARSPALRASLAPDDLAALANDWRATGRPQQLAPGTRSPGGALIASDARADWAFWLVCAGRGFGKTLAGAQFALGKARDLPGSHGALVAATSADARKTMLSAGLETVREASGILAIAPPDFRPRYESSKRLLTWPNGSVATLYSAEEPDRLRGPQHHWGWVDELAAWDRAADAFAQFLLGLRQGTNPQACVTTTPRPTAVLRDLIADPATVVTGGSTYDNLVNLAPTFVHQVVRRYEGTRLGRQELHAELLGDVDGALWKILQIEATRRTTHPALRRVVVAVDPSVSTGPSANDAGVVGVGLGEDDRLYVLADRSGKHSPASWAATAVGMFRDLRADRIVAEANQGGDMVRDTLHTVDRDVPVTLVHASRGKRARAEPVAALYEQGRVSHVGPHPYLEDQMTSWDASKDTESPGALDALVWGVAALIPGLLAPPAAAKPALALARSNPAHRFG